MLPEETIDTTEVNPENQDTLVEDQTKELTDAELESLTTEPGAVEEEELPDIEDDKLLKILAKRGLEVESLDQIKNQRADLGKLTKAHQTIKGNYNALRTKLGDQFDVLLNEALQEGSQVKPGGGFKAGDYSDLPANLRGLPKEQLDASGQLISYFLNKQIGNLMPAIFETVVGGLDQKAFRESTPDYEDYEPQMQAYAEKYGITKRDKATLAMIYDQVKGAVKKAVTDLAGNEDAIHKKTERGVPPPSPRDRGGKPPQKPTTDDDWRAEHHKRRLDE